VARNGAKVAKKKIVSRRRQPTPAARLTRLPALRTRHRDGRAAATLADAAPAALQHATLNRIGGEIVVEIAFGHAQHGAYTIQLFDSTGQNQLASENGVSTDMMPDRFALSPTPAALDQHLVQWSGAVDAFTPQPGQRYHVLFDVWQDGQVVPGGHVVKTGPLDVTQAFLGILRLVTS
jgi:hypothetical protein